jgi:hypothetical protein
MIEALVNHCRDRADAVSVTLSLHGLVTRGPWDLDISSAMAVHGYDAVKWAEGECILAELVSSEVPARSTLAAARAWLEEAIGTAQGALAAQPQLLAKLGLKASA